MPPDDKPDPHEPKETADVSAQKWMDEKRPVQRTFPGPAGQQVRLRIAMQRDAFADVTAHAKESLNAEICGVLAGEVCEDHEGVFVDVKAAVRGSAAREGGTHVTFTQETWNTIHKTMERRYPKLQIVGWYHSHPGFGVEFSEMDEFIQQNFFPSSTQFALVTDPLGGDTAICQNTPEGIRYIDRFWVDGREHRCRMPGGTQSTAGAGAALDTEAFTTFSRQMKEMEERMGQVIQAADEQRKLFNQALMAAFMFACIGIAGFVGYTIYSSYTSRFVPPEVASYIPVPVQIGDKTMLVGVGIIKWEVPPELNAVYLKLEQQKRDAEKAAEADKLLKSGSNPPAPPEQKQPPEQKPKGT